MNIIAFILAGYFALAIACYVALIGRPREPITWRDIAVVMPIMITTIATLITLGIKT